MSTRSCGQAESTTTVSTWLTKVTASPSVVGEGSQLRLPSARHGDVHEEVHGLRDGVHAEVQGRQSLVHVRHARAVLPGAEQPVPLRVAGRDQHVVPARGGVLHQAEHRRALCGDEVLAHRGEESTRVDHACVPR